MMSDKNSEIALMTTKVNDAQHQLNVAEDLLRDKAVKVRVAEYKLKMYDTLVGQVLPSVTLDHIGKLHGKCLPPFNEDEREIEAKANVVRKHIAHCFEYTQKFSLPFIKKIDILGNAFEQAKAEFETQKGVCGQLNSDVEELKNSLALLKK